MHLDEGLVQRLLDGELSPRDEQTAREHLEACAACQERLEQAQKSARELSSLLEALDEPAPKLEAASLIVRAGGAGRSRAGLAWLRRAAAILLVIGITGIVYAVPGSPVRQWVHSMVENAVRSAFHPTQDTTGGETSEPGAGLSVLPERNLLIVFRLGMVHGEGQASVRLTDGREVEIYAPAGTATFASSPGRLQIDIQRLPATFEIRIPRTAPSVEIRADQIPILVKRDGRIATSAPTAPGGAYSLPLKGQGPGSN